MKIFLTLERLVRKLKDVDPQQFLDPLENNPFMTEMKALTPVQR